jgi:hypothetical protein
MHSANDLNFAKKLGDIRTQKDRLDIETHERTMHGLSFYYTLPLSEIRIFLWYGRDFGPNDRAVIEWIGRHLSADRNPPTDWQLDKMRLKYKDYDWTVNHK